MPKYTLQVPYVETGLCFVDITADSAEDAMQKLSSGEHSPPYEFDGCNGATILPQFVKFL